MSRTSGSVQDILQSKNIIRFSALWVCSTAECSEIPSKKYLKWAGLRPGWTRGPETGLAPPRPGLSDSYRCFWANFHWVHCAPSHPAGAGPLSQALMATKLQSDPTSESDIRGNICFHLSETDVSHWARGLGEECEGVRRGEVRWGEVTSPGQKREGRQHTNVCRAQRRRGEEAWAGYRVR